MERRRVENFDTRPSGLSVSICRPSGRILVVERERYWLPELLRQFLGTRVVIEEADHWPTGTSAGTSEPGSTVLVVAELSAVQAELLHAAARTGEPLRTASILVTTAAQAGWEWPLRELGVRAVVDEFVGGRQMARLCRRLLQTRSARLPA